MNKQKVIVSNLGGQAVMEGVLIRNGGMYALAVRSCDGIIYAERHPWYSLTKSKLLQTNFVRGFHHQFHL